LLRLIGGQHRFKSRGNDAQQVEYKGANQQRADRAHHLTAGELDDWLLVFSA
jgi:hypothetical protein